MNNGTPGEQPTEGQEFDRIFALDDDALGNPAEPKPPVTPPAQAAGEGGEPNSGGQPATGDGGESGGTPTEQPAATDTPSDDDWLASANLPEDVVTRIRADREARDNAIREAQQRYDALHGRLAPTQQRLADTERRLAQMTRQPAEPAPTPPVMQPGQSLDSFFDSAEWKAYADDYPGDAKVMRSALEADRAMWQQHVQHLDARLNQLARRLESTEQVASRSVINEEISLLEKRHPDWMDINNSDEFWGWFDGWRASQPKSLRAMYYDDAKLGELFNDAEWTASLLDGYKAQHQAAPHAQVPAQAPAPQSNSTPPAQPQAPNGRLAMSVAPTVRGGAALPQAINTDGMSEAEAFDALWKLEG